MTARLNLLALDLLRCLRDPWFTVAVLVSPIATGMVFAHQLAHRTADGGPAQPYFLVSMVCMGAVSAAVTAPCRWIARDRAAGWELQARMLSGSAKGYLVGKVLPGAVGALVAVVGVLGVGRWIQQIPLGAGAMARVAATVWVGALVCCVVGAALGYLCGERTAAMTVNTLTWVSSLACGLFWPLLKVPSGLYSAAHLLPTYSVADLAHRAQQGVAPSGADVAVLLAYLLAATAVLVRARRPEAARRGLTTLVAEA
jgi:ABC-type multidrug transport system permease subunit